MTTWTVHSEAPTDSEGHPIHPDEDKGYRICAGTKSDKTTPTEHGRERDDVPYCTLRAGWGVEDSQTGKCKHHGGKAGAPPGEDNGSFKHGAFSEYFEDDMSDREVAAVDNLADTLTGDDDDAKQYAMAKVAGKAYTKFQRSGDHRFLREYRQICADFNLADTTQKHEHAGEGGGPIEHEVSAADREAALGVIRRRNETPEQTDE